MSVNVNKASTQLLRTIPFIGEKTASVLVKFRDKYGFLSKEIMEKALGGPLSKAQLELIEFGPTIKISYSESSEDEKSYSRTYNPSEMNRGHFKCKIDQKQDRTSRSDSRKSNRKKYKNI